MDSWYVFGADGREEGQKNSYSSRDERCLCFNQCEAALHPHILVFDRLKPESQLSQIAVAAAMPKWLGFDHTMLNKIEH
jgi:hypothetical protein